MALYKTHMPPLAPTRAQLSECTLTATSSIYRDGKILAGDKIDVDKFGSPSSYQCGNGQSSQCKVSAFSLFGRFLKNIVPEGVWYAFLISAGNGRFGR